jgi:hypothetical protein
MPSSGMLRLVTVVKDLRFEECVVSMIRVEAIHSIETSVCTRATRRRIPVDGIIQTTIILAVPCDFVTNINHRYHNTVVVDIT